MKSFSLVLFLALIMSSCNNNSTLVGVYEEGYNMGIVKDRGSNPGCGFVIESCADSKQIFVPVDLPEEFRVDEAAVSFKYSRSRAPHPAGCNEGMRVVLDEIKWTQQQSNK